MWWRRSSLCLLGMGWRESRKPESYVNTRSVQQRYMEPIIGKSNRVYEVLNRKRPLTLAMIRRLHQSLGIPADVLIAETATG